MTAVGCCGRRLVCGLVGSSLIGSSAPFRLLILRTACSCGRDLCIVCCRGLLNEGTIWRGQDKRAGGEMAMMYLVLCLCIYVRAHLCFPPLLCRVCDSMLWADVLLCCRCSGSCCCGCRCIGACVCLFPLPSSLLFPLLGFGRLPSSRFFVCLPPFSRFCCVDAAEDISDVSTKHTDTHMHAYMHTRSCAACLALSFCCCRIGGRTVGAAMISLHPYARARAGKMWPPPFNPKGAMSRPSHREGGGRMRLRATDECFVRTCA